MFASGKTTKPQRIKIKSPKIRLSIGIHNAKNLFAKMLPENKATAAIGATLEGCGNTLVNTEMNTSEIESKRVCDKLFFIG